MLHKKSLAILASLLTSSLVFATPLVPSNHHHHHRELAAKIAEREIPVVAAPDADAVLPRDMAAAEEESADMALEARAFTQSGLIPLDNSRWERSVPEETEEEVAALAVRDIYKRGSGKNGLGWLNGPKLSLFIKGSKPVGWCYTWSEWRCEPNNLGIENVPMLWGTSADKVQKFKNYVKKYPPKWVLTYNEPDLSSQSGLSVDNAVNVWMSTVNKLKAGKVSPAPSGGPSGVAWLRKFINKCNQRGCQIDHVAVHFYATNSQDLINFVQGVYNEFKKPIWVTEFACRNFGTGSYCNPSQAAKFNAEVIGWFESTGYIFRYSAFGSLRDMYNVGDGPRLLNAAGTSLTTLGKQYVGA